MKTIEKSKKLVSVLNYGCSANHAIAEGLMGILERHGYIISDSVEDTEVIIVNTCVVKQNTEHRMKSKLLSLSKTKDIVVTGCLPVVMRDWVSKNLPNARVLFPEAANCIIDLLNNHPVQEIKTSAPHTWSQLYTDDRLRYNPVITTVEISRGCLGSCAFCIVRNIKGKVRSRSQESILTEIQLAIERGSKEIRLTSQDIGTYGWDFSPKLYIPTLIESIARLKGDFFIRLGMMTPITLKRFLTPLVQQLRTFKVFSFLHLPIQVGSDSILQKMKRKETGKYFIDLVKQLRQEIDELVFATDIMVGFPGESQKDYEATKRLLQEVRPIIVNISKYTDRPGTLASQLSPKIPTKIKANRSRELTELTRDITQRELRRWIGWEGIILIYDYGKHTNQFIGRNTSYIPILVEGEKISLGQVLKILVTEAGPNYLIGERKNGDKSFH
ncbi:MAG: tRNA (N(6)-L-threonylcarbamoyladenosine(37)-C(2))-methylthiotransferase [Candidatus Heimdallarchaeota archaeon]|nr:MAG: tRNA (N(6)-L-threonylcarbamoyladenosine(37)-C(2))-methylthiotransferase [Candidatus Heimdallarchaeota archaeon]